MEALLYTYPEISVSMSITSDVITPDARGPGALYQYFVYYCSFVETELLESSNHTAPEK